MHTRRNRFVRARLVLGEVGKERWGVLVLDVTFAFRMPSVSPPDIRHRGQKQVEVCTRHSLVGVRIGVHAIAERKRWLARGRVCGGWEEGGGEGRGV